ncbi:MAG: glutathione S-transferase C-terminal domain-containing protein, partial [Caulobacteraceae bacterium]|nr:glutathione S-transferase C-terminal domain-containing protein [Caulobacteraceae bacterium]
AALGPMTGQMGFFHKFAGKDIEDKRPRDRFVAEVKRLLGVLEGRLADRPFIMGDDFTIADIALIGWVRAIPGFYGAGDLVDWGNLKAVPEWVARCEARPAVAKGLMIPARPS